MTNKALVMISPHNWYNHVLPNKVNRPLKIIEAFNQTRKFQSILIVNRINPKKIFKKEGNTRELLTTSYLYNLYLDKPNNVYYLEHCLPFGIFEEKILPIILKKVLEQIKISEWVFWISDPKSIALFKSFKTKKVFDAYDDWSISPFYIKKRRHLKYIKRGYNSIKLYPETFVLTNTLFMKNKFKNNKVYLVNNASSLDVVDIRTHNSLSDQKTVGYIGNIHERIDLDLLRYVIEVFPNVNFTFVGDNEYSSTSFQDLVENYNNIALVKAVDYKKVPEVISSFDVCFIPHKVNNYTKSQDSMKMYDYLALGKPVVTTNIPPADIITESGLLYKADSKDDFVEKLSKALIEDDLEMVAKRINFIKENNWLKKANFIYTLLFREEN